MSDMGTENSFLTSSLVEEASRHYSAGEYARAKQSIIEALKRDMADPRSLYLGGRIALKNQEFGTAIRLFTEAIKYRDSDPNICCHLGVALAAAGKLDAAVHAYERALEIDPDNKDALLHMGHILCRRNQFADAIGFYERLLALEPDHINAAANLADLLEKRSRIEEAESIVDKGLKAKPRDPGLVMVKARLKRRQGRNREAIELLQKMLQQDMPLSIAAEAHYILGLLYDHEDMPEEAFRYFEEGNRLTAARLDPKQIDKTAYLREVEQMGRLLDECVPFPAPQNNSDELENPVFLVGFPRSGTTLLGQILDSHPRLATLEERPTVAAMDAAFCAIAERRKCTLNNLTESDIAELRRVYFRAVSECPEAQAGERIVDKMPLNISKVPLIHRVFPGVRFILAVRHPCDACLSCFMQYFSVNNAMANFLTLQDSAALYARVMDIWKRSVSVLQPHFHMIRYEDLVADLQGETTRLLDFMGIEWEDAVLAYHEHAGDSDTVDTPSYHQVTKPIYKEATFRWKRYEKQLAPVLGDLEPYIEYFGYSKDSR